MAILYKATNAVTGDFYIGITKNNIAKRKREHICAAKRGDKGCHIFNSAIRKYGHENFVWEKLSEIENYDAALAEEVRLISDLKPRYNITQGGKGMIGIPRTAEWYQKVSASLKGRKPSQATIDGRRKFFENGGQKKKVICINDGKVFDGLKDASIFYGIGNGQITNVCNGGQLTAKGLVFRKYNIPISDGERLQILEAIKNKKRQIDSAKKALPVICLNNGVVYPSGTAAAKELNLCQMTISNICLGKRNATRSGLKFRFYNEVAA